MTTFNLIDLSECMSVLEFISTIRFGHKPYYNNRTTISTKRWFVTLRRRLNGVKGENSIKYVINVMDSCFSYYKEGTADKRLKEYLVDSLDGFGNLIETYSDQEIVMNGYRSCKAKALLLIRRINSDTTKQRGFFDLTNVSFGNFPNEKKSEKKSEKRIE